MLPILGLVGGILTEVIGGVKDHLAGKRKVKEAITQNKIKLAQSEQSHNQAWEMKQLDNAGWKDDILFYAFIGLFIWAGFDPDGATKFFENLNVLPDWFIKTWFWLIASILGVKKIGDYVPQLMGAIKDISRK
jgi:hypothetical protein